jgi:tetratricopeptide (TPR) repeat protein
MLFDLRGRGRRRTVQSVYLALAIILGGGLVLFGVGTGSGVGGLLDAFTNNGSNSNKPVISQAEKSAVKQTQLQPNNPAAWAALVQARYSAANQYANQTTGAYSSAGNSELKGATQAWQRYLALTKNPDWTLAQLVARAYSSLGDYKNATTAWQFVTRANPNVATYFENLAVSAWSAKENELGDLAQARALSLTPKAQQAQMKQTLQQLKSQAASASASAQRGG